MSEPDSELVLRLERRLGSFRLDVDCRLPARGITAVFGPSGAGKSTLLRCIAGLDRGQGSVRLGSRPWQVDAQRIFVPTHRRGVGYVFQEASLFAHLSVRENLEYGWRRTPARERRIRREEVLEALGLASLVARPTAGLSGGERQRVALARALLSSPSLLLCDEPLAALDKASREEILPYLERLHERFELPVLYVSHSWKEVARLCDHILLLAQGRVRAVGPLTEIAARLDLAAEDDDEVGAVLEAEIAVHDEGYELSGLESAFGRLWVRRLEAPLGKRVRVQILARDVSLALEPELKSTILNAFPARLVELRPLSHGQVLVGLESRSEGGRARLLARITRRSADALALHAGCEVWARVKSVSLLA